MKVKFIGSQNFYNGDKKKCHFDDGQVAEVSDADLKILIKGQDYIPASEVKEEDGKKSSKKRFFEEQVINR